MKKTWNVPNIEELTIQSTAFWNHGGWGHGKPNPPHRPGGDFGGCGKCRCEGGISPCEKHHGFFTPDDPEDETSSF